MKGRESACRFVAVPDIFLPDGTVMHGQATRANWLRERRNKVWAEARSFLAATIDEGRPLTRSEERRWDQLQAELSYLDARLAEALGYR